MNWVEVTKFRGRTASLKPTSPSLEQVEEPKIKTSYVRAGSPKQKHPPQASIGENFGTCAARSQICPAQCYFLPFQSSYGWRSLILGQCSPHPSLTYSLLTLQNLHQFHPHQFHSVLLRGQHTMLY